MPAHNAHHVLSHLHVFGMNGSVKRNIHFITEVGSEGHPHHGAMAWRVT
jgi:hypothetical protein